LNVLQITRHMEHSAPRVGVGVIVLRSVVLLGKRIGSHGAGTCGFVPQNAA
jgi:hypothetical protein